MSGAQVDRLIPSVEEAQNTYQGTVEMHAIWRSFCECPAYRCDGCRSSAAVVEAASVALDMANAQASDRRRAEDDEIRRSVAW